MTPSEINDSWWPAIIGGTLFLGSTIVALSPRPAKDAPGDAVTAIIGGGIVVVSLFFNASVWIRQGVRTWRGVAPSPPQHPNHRG